MAPLAEGNAARIPYSAARYSSRAEQLSEYFAPQHTSTTALPDPEPFLRNLTRGVLEVFSGVRHVEQLARWLTEDAFRRLAIRANLATRARSARGVAAARPVHSIVSVRCTMPADGVVEAVVIVSAPARTRAVALRLEGMDSRWRCTSLALL
ncbi:MAG: Rv3235 family protein [Microbacterium sp.]|uniref:Rv3235 family protein n=1 Tax=Microbacterium sp. TaxID=51671 RepID=UPI003A87E24D